MQTVEIPGTNLVVVFFLRGGAVWFVVVERQENGFLAGRELGHFDDFFSMSSVFDHMAEEDFMKAFPQLPVNCTLTKEEKLRLGIL